MSYSNLPKSLKGDITTRFSIWTNQMNNNLRDLDTRFGILVILERLATVSLRPATAGNGESYIIESTNEVHTYINGTWHISDLQYTEIYYDIALANFYFYDGTYNLLLQGISGDIPSGEKILFYAATAPSGYTLDATINDRIVRVVNTTGGVISGTWDDLTHQHTIIHTHEHNHTHNSGSYAARFAYRANANEAEDDQGYVFQRATGLTAWTATDGNGTWPFIDTTTEDQNNSDSNSNGVDVAGDSGSPDDSTTDSQSTNNSGIANVTHGSLEHACADFILCTRL
ncbi:MAG: hypothetical protein KDH96_00140 [Candidatus Riesia sp.]|nr:hypothetical protein [Candidatus Riesia sp.]